MKVTVGRVVSSKVGRVIGTSSMLVIQAHQEDILEAFIRPCGECLMSVSSFALPESPNMREFPRGAQRAVAFKRSGSEPSCIACVVAPLRRNFYYIDSKQAP